MKNKEISLTLETYTNFPSKVKIFNYYKAWDISGSRKITCRNFIFNLLGTIYWFTFSTWKYGEYASKSD